MEIGDEQSQGQLGLESGFLAIILEFTIDIYCGFLVNHWSIKGKTTFFRFRR